MLDRYISGIKSVSLATSVALLVGLVLAISRFSIVSAHQEAMRWYWATLMLRAEAMVNGEIVAIGGVDQLSWRTEHDSRPKHGRILDVVRNLTDTESVSGRITTDERRIVDFTSAPMQSDHVGCLARSGTRPERCMGIELRQDGVLTQAYVFVYERPKGDAGKWWVLDDSAGEFVDIEGAEDRVIRVAQPWAGKTGSSGDAYQAITDEMETERIKLPVVNLELPARLASLSLAIFALISSYKTAASLSALNCVYDRRDQKEPWILQRPTVNGAGFMCSVHRALSWLSRSSAYSGIWAPGLMLSICAYLAPSPASQVVVGAIATPALLLMMYSTLIFASLLKRME